MSKVLIDRAVLEQALEALEHHVEQTRPIYKTTMAIEALIAALEQPQDHSEQRLDMVPADWKLVPVEPTSEMIAAGKESMQYSIAELPAFTCYNAMLRAAPQPPVVEQPQVEAATGKDYLQVPAGFVLLQTENGKPVYSACLDGGRFHGWLMWKHPDGQWVSKRKLEAWEIMQAEDQRDYGIVQGD